MLMIVLKAQSEIDLTPAWKLDVYRNSVYPVRQVALDTGRKERLLRTL